MKRTVALAILGLGVMAVNTAVAQGHVGIWNYYVAPYNQVVWDASVPAVGNTAVLDAGLQLDFWVAPGVVADPNALALSGNPSFGIDLANPYDPGAGFGGGGYYPQQTLLTPGTGTYTVQIRASGSGFGSSALFQVDTVATTLPVPDSGQSVGMTVFVPEPTTFALAGLGAAALLIFRRRD